MELKHYANLNSRKVLMWKKISTILALNSLLDEDIVLNICTQISSQLHSEESGMKFCLSCRQVRGLDHHMSYPWKTITSEGDFSTSSEAEGRDFCLKTGILTYFHFLGTCTKLPMQCKMRQTLKLQKELWIWVVIVWSMISKILISKIFSKKCTAIVK